MKKHVECMPPNQANLITFVPYRLSAKKACRSKLYLMCTVVQSMHRQHGCPNSEENLFPNAWDRRYVGRQILFTDWSHGNLATMWSCTCGTCLRKKAS